MAVIPTTQAEYIRLIVDGTFVVVVSPIALRDILAAVACVLVIHFDYLFANEFLTIRKAGPSQIRRIPRVALRYPKFFCSNAPLFRNIFMLVIMSLPLFYLV